ncbi:MULTISPECIES: hypothetical protein [unclassified Okeania]|uniref:hypothetical protein n=1 Tax=unclassified Okeania TaxID=2634635 RepID=UPI0013C63B01|nr:MULTISPECIES: hypothetical protein [unclassified Okeania]NES79271.1 hypothetical protein [Okeania sp. SIO1H4]
MRRQQLRKATAPEGGLKKETGDRREEENYMGIVFDKSLRVYAPPSNFEHPR